LYKGIKRHSKNPAFLCPKTIHKNPEPDKIPCFRVVNFKGELSGEFAFGGAGAQQKLLEAEGIEVINGKVDLAKFGMK
jgi:alkylated DNA nucleotide flippase Atl1